MTAPQRHPDPVLSEQLKAIGPWHILAQGAAARGDRVAYEGYRAELMRVAAELGMQVPK